MTERVRKRKEAILEAPESLCLERARIYTETYREHEAEPYVVRRALGLANLLDGMTVEIYDGELVVGNYASQLGAYIVYPEYTFKEPATKYSDYDFAEIMAADFESKEPTAMSGIPDDIREYWAGRSIQNRADTVMPPDIQQSRDHLLGGNPYGRFEGHGHIAVDYAKAIREGFASIIADAKARMRPTRSRDPVAYQFYRAVVITSEAVVRFANRFADEADRLAAGEADPQRRAELETIAVNCRHVPEQPAETFWQACQAFWFVHLIMHFEQNGFSISPGRFDQYMLPYYRRDLKSGETTEDKALELIECCWVKMMEISIGGVKLSLTPTVTLCGSTPDGRDCTNELSFLCLRATRETRMVQPQLTVRWHPNLSAELMDAVLEMIRDGLSTPALVSDLAIVPGLTKLGIPAEDAHEYVPLGCNETGIGGKLIGGGIPRGVSLVKSLELALYGGRSRYTGLDIGVPCKTLGEYESFDELLDAYRRQVEHFTEKVVAGINMMDAIHQEMGNLPFASSVMSGTLDRGRDIMFATDYFHLAMGCTDMINTVDSLHAIRKVVFEQGEATQAELREALDANFEGHEALRKKLLAQAKFGNDDDEVDRLLPVVEKISADAVAGYRSWRMNTPFVFECIPRIAHVREGLKTKATPDGRLATTPLAAGMSSGLGLDRDGPTALLNSIAKLDRDQWVGGVISNIRFHPNLLKDEASRTKVRHMLAAYFKRGGQHLQMNCVSREQLIEAQKHPEQSRDLIVRVSGYNDYFTSMTKKSQDEIIARTEHEQ